MTDDLRRNPRVPLDVEVDVEHDGHKYVGRAHDISLGGMFVNLRDAVPFGANVTLRFRIGTSDTPLALPGVVRWRRDDGVGVQFGAFGVRETYAITEWVKRSG